jgi:hypothetical protein
MLAAAAAPRVIGGPGGADGTATKKHTDQLFDYHQRSSLMRNRRDIAWSCRTKSPESSAALLNLPQWH